MRISISAQSCDSVPPAPGWTVTMALSGSVSPESMVLDSSFFGEVDERGDLALEVGLGASPSRGEFEVGFDVVGAAREFGVVGEQGLQGACARASAAATARRRPRRWGRRFFLRWSASSRFRRGESKILPQLANLFADRGVGVFKIVNIALVYCEFICRRPAPAVLPAALVVAEVAEDNHREGDQAHSHANQSPWRV